MFCCVLSLGRRLFILQCTSLILTWYYYRLFVFCRSVRHICIYCHSIRPEADCSFLIYCSCGTYGTVNASRHSRVTSQTSMPSPSSPLASPLAQALMTLLAVSSTFAPTRRWVCSHTTTSSVASRVSLSASRDASCWVDTMTSIAMSGTLSNRIGLVCLPLPS